MSLIDGYQPPTADLYAARKAFDIAWERRVVDIEEAQPATSVDEPAEVVATSAAVAAPAEPEDGRRACPCCQGSGREPEGVTESEKTGRRYTERTTARGNTYGLEVGGRFVRVTASGHTIEIGRGGAPSLDRFVDRLADRLGKRAAAVEEAKGRLTAPEHRKALDDLLQHWFRHPTAWPATHKRIKATAKDMRLHRWQALPITSILNQPSFRSTWDE